MALNDGLKKLVAKKAKVPKGWARIQAHLETLDDEGADTLADMLDELASGDADNDSEDEDEDGG